MEAGLLTQEANPIVLISGVEKLPDIIVKKLSQEFQ